MSKGSAPYPELGEAPPVYQTYPNDQAPPPMPNQNPPPPSTYPSQTYPPNPQPTVYTQPTVINVEPGRGAIIINNALGPYPTTTTCPHCSMTGLTEVSHDPGLLTWLIAGLCFIFGFWLCCCLPFCIDSCQDVQHRCSNCKKYIGTYKRL